MIITWHNNLSSFPQASSKNVIDWLQETQSMTSRLQQAMQPTPLTVQLLASDWSTPSLEESAYLAIQAQELAFIREVWLQPESKPAWMFARSIFSPQLMASKLGQKILTLHTQPLGAWLFNHPNLNRSTFEYALWPLTHPWLTKFCNPKQTWPNDTHAYVRRSKFLVDKKPFSLVEVFLPPLWQQQP